MRFSAGAAFFTGSRFFDLDGWQRFPRTVKAYDCEYYKAAASDCLVGRTQAAWADFDSCQKSPFSIAHSAGGIAGIFGGTFLHFKTRNAVLELDPNVLWGSRQSLIPHWKKL